KDDSLCEAIERRRRLGSGVTAVDDDGLAQLLGQLELGSEQSPLLDRRGEAMVIVEASLSNRDGKRMGGQGAQLVESLRLWRSGLVRIDSERGNDDAVARLGDAQRCAARFDPGSHGDDSIDAGCTGALDNGCGGLVARVEVRVRVGHAAAVGASMRGNSGAAA